MQRELGVERRESLLLIEMWGSGASSARTCGLFRASTRNHRRLPFETSWSYWLVYKPSRRQQDSLTPDYSNRGLADILFSVVVPATSSVTISVLVLRG
jgi:hypothetical protein